jgi:ATP-dependent Clp protease ATP-binding subunit ClpC
VVSGVLLQVLDNGRLTDAKGRVVNFKNTVIIMTSNIGAQYIDKMSGLGFGAQGSQASADERYTQAKSKVMDSLKEYFRPEFLNRLDEIILFNILSPEHVRDIVRKQVDIVGQRLAEKRIALSVTDAALEHLAKEGYNPQYGARPLKRMIQTAILTPIANMMVARGVLEGGAVKVDFNAKGGADGRGEFTFDVRKGPERECLDSLVTKTV